MLKTFHMLIQQVSHKNLKTEVDKLDIDNIKSLSNNLSNLKDRVDKLGIDELEYVPVDLSKLSNVVKSEVV